ncbi:MAG: phosphonate metabolism protein/1,5-bisphosphokinase (PRPP-forming) PhnN [Pseudomonadota bacterium]
MRVSDPGAAGGVLLQVMGPSGVGKDTLMAGARAALAERAGWRFVRRAITRPAAPGDAEAHEPLTPDAFAAAAAAGRFFATWHAHGLDYGVPSAVAAWLAAGDAVILNGSRVAAAAVTAAAHAVPAATAIVAIQAPAAAVAARLAARGREDAAAAAARLARAVPPPPQGVPLFAVANDADVATGVDRLLAALHAAAGRRLPAPSA